MRDLTMNEMAFVSGAEDHTVTVVDPVALVQTFALLYSVTDQATFQRASTIVGMGVGGIAGGMIGYSVTATAYGVGVGILASAGGVIGGAFAAGALCRVGSMGAVAMFNTLMG